MLYASDLELPERVKKVLPKNALDIYREAFNDAWEKCADPAKRRMNLSRKETAHRVAWAAVKNKYKKTDEQHVKKRE